MSLTSLNESPSEKEGKFASSVQGKRTASSLNESPSEKEGKYRRLHAHILLRHRLNESPSEKEGKSAAIMRLEIRKWLPQ